MTWLKSLYFWRLRSAWPQSDEALDAQRFAPCGSLQMQSVGWLGDAYRPGAGHVILSLCVERKNLPKQVIDREVDTRARDLAAQQGFMPGRQQRKEIRETVIDDLLPRAFATQNVYRVWIDTRRGTVATDGNPDTVLRALLRTYGNDIALDSIRPKYSPSARAAVWITNDEAPHGFTIDDAAELRASGDGRATVRYIRHTLDSAELTRHIAFGKQCTKLAMTWADRVSFVLHDDMTLSGVAPLDVLKESAANKQDGNGDMVLMCEEYARLFADMLDALGGAA